MAKKQVFISFDFDNDSDLRDNLVHQSTQPNSPFSMVDCSVRAPYDEKWRQRVRSIIRRVDLVIVICGLRTDIAKGVAAELTMAQEEGTRYFLLRGRRHRTCARPPMARRSDPIHDWTWPNLHQLIYTGGRV